MEYLGKSLKEILEPLDMTIDEFIDVCDQFTNKRILCEIMMEKLYKDKNGNLTKLNYDN